MIESKEAAPGPATPGDGLPQPPCDRDLVERSLHGDLQAFEALVARYQKAVFHIAHYKCRNYFDAEDLSQDIFLAAFRALPSLKDLNNFGGWLFGIAHNRSNKWYQRQRSKIIRFQELQRRKAEEALRKPPEPQEGPDPTQVLSESLLKLDPEVRQVLVLKYLEGLSYQVIEERLGINAHRIDYLIRKGKELLRQRMRQEGAAVQVREP
jgi:RNA polymerase sigma-70 factor, ECF subfamily